MSISKLPKSNMVKWNFTCPNCEFEQEIRTNFIKRAKVDKETTKEINTSIYCPDCKKVTSGKDPRDFVKEDLKSFDWLETVEEI